MVHKDQKTKIIHKKTKLAGTYTFSSCNKGQCMSRGEYNLFLYSLNIGALHMNQYTHDTGLLQDTSVHRTLNKYFNNYK